MSDIQDPSNKTQSKPHSEYRLKDLTAVKWLLFLAVLYTLYFAQSLVIPLVFTALIALMLSPLVTLLKSFFIPRAVSSIVLLAALIAPFTFLGIELAEPAQKWAGLLPKLSVHLTEQVESISDAFEKQEKEEKKALNKRQEKEQGFSFFGWFQDDPEPEEEPKNDAQNRVTERIKQGGLEIMLELISATPYVLAQLVTSIILILFLLIFGPELYVAFISTLSTHEEKQRALNLVSTIQAQLSRYVITVSSINLLLGLFTAIALNFIGMEDALLWGVLVGLLNFIPYVGSIIGVAVLCLASIVQYGLEIHILLPVGVYLGLNLLESQFITPTILGKNMLINPLVVMLWLLICGWLWGVVGVLISVPLLVCIKLALSELGIWKNWLKVIEAGG